MPCQYGVLHKVIQGCSLFGVRCSVYTFQCSNKSKHRCIVQCNTRSFLLFSELGLNVPFESILNWLHACQKDEIILGSCFTLYSL